MTLLAPLALLVGLTALVPLILHLYQRRRRTVIEFSTNRFFTAAIIRSQRRLRLRRLLLLLLRVATCILLALALARPLTTLAGFGGAAGTRDVVILLDDSLSMRARAAGQIADAGTPSRFEQARTLAQTALSELSAGDRAAVITFTGRTIGLVTRGGLELTEDIQHVAGEIERMRPTYAAGDAHAAIKRAADLFRAASPRHRLLLVLSDLQSGDWRQAQWPQPAHPVAVALVHVAKPPEQNVVADRLEFSQATAVVGQPNLLRVRLVNYASETTPAELVLQVDEHERLRRPIELAGQSPHVERVPLVFDKPGTHQLELTVAARDALETDNTLYATLRVNPRLPILLVDGRSDSQAERSAATFLRAALRAVSAEGDAIQVDTIRPDALSADALEDCRVAILSEVPRLSVAQVECLERFVENGGGLAIFLGDHADRAFYNEIMGAETRPLGGLLPATVGPLIESRETMTPLHILAADVEHPILQRFQGTLRGALAGVAVYRAYSVEPRAAWVLASLDDGLPLLAERSYGSGRVLLCAAAPHPHWTNLPLRRLFVPLCSRTVSHLAGGGVTSEGHFVGQELELLRGGWDVEQPVYLRDPDGSRLRAAVKVIGAEPVAYVEGEELRRPGFYRVEAGTGERATQRLALNTPRRESSPDTLDIAAAESFADRWQLNIVDAADVLTREDASSPGEPSALLGAGWLSRGIWDAMLWTIFVLVLAEPLIANQLVRLRRKQADARERRAA